MKHRIKSSTDQDQQQAATSKGARLNTQREFSSIEEMLRFDAGQTAVPPEIAARLKDSLASDKPDPSASWWRNLFGR